MAGNKKIPKEKTYSREQLKKRARLFRLVSSFSPAGSNASKKPAGKELFLPTEVGQVRVLTYNMESEQKLPLFVNIHGGGFVIGSPEMDDPYLMNVADQANVPIS
jgi:acetyl esterase